MFNAHALGIADMKRSPLRHTLAVLRTTIGLSQKEMADLIGRSTRTVQAIELGTLPLSEDLAAKIAKETAIDLGWLLDNDPDAPPRNGLTMFGIMKGQKPYTREVYESHRAFVESPMADEARAHELIHRMHTEVDEHGVCELELSLPEQKAVFAEIKSQALRKEDSEIIASLKRLLDATITKNDGDLVRWKIRRHISELARQNKVSLAQSSTSQTSQGTGKNSAKTVR
jgi:transcriptional regulator with XRE-family HTH domain